MTHTTWRIIFMLGILSIIPALSSCAAARKNQHLITFGLGVSTGAANLGMTKMADAMAQTFCPEDFVCKDNRRYPLPGFKRVNPDKGWKVEWTPGITHPEHAHIIAAKTKYSWIPEPGYRWASGEMQGERRYDENNLEVKSDNSANSEQSSSSQRVFEHPPSHQLRPIVPLCPSAVPGVCDPSPSHQLRPIDRLTEPSRETVKPVQPPREDRKYTQPVGVAIVFDPPSNVRRSPNGDFLCSVKTSTTVKIYSATGSWYYTDVCGEIGVIHSSQVKF